MKAALYFGAFAGLMLAAAYGSTNVGRTIVAENGGPGTGQALGALTIDALRAARIAAALDKDASTRGAGIRVTVEHGRARLSGFVERAAARLRAARLAEQADGIIDVDNRLILPYRPSATIDRIAGARVLL